MKSKKLFFTLLLSLSFLVTACTSAKETTSEIRIAHFPNVTHAQALISRSQNLFEKHIGPDYKVSYKVFNAGPAEIEAFFAGELDLGYIGPVPAINGHIKSDGDIVILAGATNAGAMLIAQKNSTINTISDLSGKKIAIPQIGNTQHLSLLSLLSENGLKDTTKGGTVEVIAAANPDIRTLLSSGNIDAAYVPEPWASRLVFELDAKIVLDEKEVFRNGNYSTAVVIGRKEFVEKNPDLVKRFLMAHLEATNFLNNNPTEAATQLNNQIKEHTGQKLAKEVMDSVLTRLDFNYDPITDSVMDFMNISLSENFISKLAESDQIFYFSILNDLLEADGKAPIK